MRELRVGMIGDIGLDLLPVTVIIPDILARSTYRKQAFRLNNKNTIKPVPIAAGCRENEIGIYLVLPPALNITDARCFLCKAQ